MRILKKQLKITSGIFISKEMLSKANINAEDVELEITDHEVRIRAADHKNKRKILDANSPLWDCVGFAQVEGINGRDHDEYIYE
jgi:hypothetical protein